MSAPSALTACPSSREPQDSTSTACPGSPKTQPQQPALGAPRLGGAAAAPRGPPAGGHACVPAIWAGARTTHASAVHQPGACVPPPLQLSILRPISWGLQGAHARTGCQAHAQQWQVGSASNMLQRPARRAVDGQGDIFRDVARTRISVTQVKPACACPKPGSARRGQARPSRPVPARPQIPSGPRPRSTASPCTRCSPTSWRWARQPAATCCSSGRPRRQCRAYRCRC